MSHYYSDGIPNMYLHMNIYRDIETDLGGLGYMLDDIKNYNKNVLDDTEYKEKEVAELRLQFALAAKALAVAKDILDKKL